jgi:hypothetical protein
MSIQYPSIGVHVVGDFPYDPNQNISNVSPGIFGRVDKRNAYNLPHNVNIEEYQIGEYLTNDSQIATLCVISKNGKCQKAFSNGYIQDCYLIKYSEGFDLPDEYLVKVKVLNKEGSTNIRIPVNGIKPNDFVNLFRSQGGMSFFGSRSNREIYELMSNLLASLIIPEKIILVDYYTGWNQQKFIFPNQQLCWHKSPLTERKLNITQDSNVLSTTKYLNAISSCFSSIDIRWLITLWTHYSVLHSLFIVHEWYIAKILCLNGSHDLMRDMAKYFFSIYEKSDSYIIPIGSSQDKLYRTIHDAKDEMIIIEIGATDKDKESRILRTLSDLIDVFSHRGTFRRRSTKAQTVDEIRARSQLLIISDGYNIPRRTKEVIQIDMNEEEFNMSKYISFKKDSPHAVPTHLRHFLQWVEIHYDQVQVIIEDNVITYLQSESISVSSDNRYLFSILMATYHILLAYCKEINIPMNFFVSSSEMQQIMLGIINKHELLSSGDLEDVIPEIIIDHIVKNNIIVIRKTAHINGSTLSLEYILYDDDFIYIKRELIDNLLKEALGSNYSINDILAGFVEKGFLTRYDLSHNSYRYRLTLSDKTKPARFSYLRFNRCFLSNISDYETI